VVDEAGLPFSFFHFVDIIYCFSASCTSSKTVDRLRILGTRNFQEVLWPKTPGFFLSG
jgi:hypothetical protein